MPPIGASRLAYLAVTKLRSYEWFIHQAETGAVLELAINHAIVPDEWSEFVG